MIRSFSWLWRRMNSFDLRLVTSWSKQKTRRKYWQPRKQLQSDCKLWLWFRMMFFISKYNHNWVIKNLYSGKVLGTLTLLVITALLKSIVNGTERAPIMKKLVQNSARTCDWWKKYFILSFSELHLRTSKVFIHEIFIVRLVNPAFL